MGWLSAVLGGVVLTCTEAGCSSSTSAGATPADAGTEAGEAGVVDADPGDAASEAEAGSCKLSTTYGSTACNRCMGERCCAVVTTCDSDPECKVLEACVTGCLLDADAGGCRQLCLDAHPAAKARWDSVESCWFGSPATGCIVDCT